MRTAKQVKEKCLRFVIGEIQEILKRNDVREIKWIQGEMQSANCLTKRGTSSDPLKCCLNTRKLKLMSE